MTKNEDLIRERQEVKVKVARENPVNTQRQHIKEWPIVLWHFGALVAVFFWLMRLLGVVDITA